MEESSRADIFNLESEIDELQSTITHLVRENERLRGVAEKLWDLLDDIDTSSDVFKPPHTRFYTYVMKKVAKRFSLISSDGHKLIWPEPLRAKEKS